MKNKTIKGYKGFDKNLKCRDFQFEVGKEFKHSGKVEACSSGFHYCENPFDVFSYYPPAGSRYCEVEGSGEISKENGDSKVAVSNLKLKLEIGLNGLLNAGVKFILERVKWDEENTNSNTGNYSAATNTGNYSAATNTGDQSAATNTGNYSAATNTGNYSAATNTGNYSAATNTGYQSAATVEGKDSIACALGYESKAKAYESGWIVIVDYRMKNGERFIYNIHSAKIGNKIKKVTIEPNVFYWFENGELKNDKGCKVEMIHNNSGLQFKKCECETKIKNRESLNVIESLFDDEVLSLDDLE